MASRTAFTEQYGPWALVAGATEGIGREFVLELAARGLGVVLLARREAVLEAVAQEVTARHGTPVRTCAVDLGRADAADVVRAALGDLPLGLVVCCAAQSQVGEFTAQPVAQHLRTVDVNCRALVLLAHALLPPMVARGRGGLVVVSSLTALQGAGLTAVYAATKAFDLVLAESLWEEVRGHGVDVLSVLAGATRTPTLERSQPRPSLLVPKPGDPRSVAVTALDALGTGPTVVPGRLNRSMAWLMRLVPRRTAIGLISGTLRRMYPR